MTTTLTYLDAVREELADLPEDEREELLADVASSGDDDTALAARLGPPSQFARELRSAAGLQLPGAPAPRRPAPLERSRALAARVTPLARELAPLGWLVRGYVAAVAIAFTVDGDWHIDRPAVFFLRDNVWNAFWLCAICVAVSVAAGVALRLAKRRSTALVAFNIIVALGALPVAGRIVDQLDSPARSSSASEEGVAPGLAYDGRPLANVYPYDRAGRPLYDVRLYDEYGRALNVGGGAPDLDRRVPRTARGTMAFNAFPIRYFEPRSTRVADPAEGFRPRVALVRPKPIRRPR